MSESSKNATAVRASDVRNGERYESAVAAGERALANREMCRVANELSDYATRHDAEGFLAMLAGDAGRYARIHHEAAMVAEAKAAALRFALGER